MISSSITGLTIKNSPVQVFSINGAQDLALTGITIDDSAGDAGQQGHNTDAFDVGSSSGVTISGVNVKNQDDCLAVNSGTVRLISSILLASKDVLNYKADIDLEYHIYWW